jgi:hypothetical protein
MNVLVIDIGGTNAKVWKTGEGDCEKFSSGKKLTPRRLVDRIKLIADTWPYERVSLGYPGKVHHGRPVEDPYNLAPGWVAYDWCSAFGCPLRIMNDACMQALGSYEGGRMLYLGLGTGLGTVFIIDGRIVPLALGHLPFRDGLDFGHYLSRKGLKLHGTIVWRNAVLEAGASLQAAFFADYVVLGGGNAKKLGDLPDGFRKGGNHNAYFGGLRMWEDGHIAESPRLSVVQSEDAPETLDHDAQSPAQIAF